MEQFITVIRLILKWISDRVNNICSVRHVPDFKSKMWKTVFRLLLFDNETRCVCKTLCLPPSPPPPIGNPKEMKGLFTRNLYMYIAIAI